MYPWVRRGKRGARTWGDRRVPVNLLYGEANTNFLFWNSIVILNTSGVKTPRKFRRGPENPRKKISVFYPGHSVRIDPRLKPTPPETAASFDACEAEANERAVKNGCPARTRT